ncbi:MAG: type I DNA topoisomerase [Candidatus Komeilibacteria bacterium]|nr:type I DNA topoisomerase [Candidatus Komeilibacteria bacterium]
MPANLIIVESPTKAKTIARFLGDDFRVESSFGHVRDLPKSKMGVDLEHNFEPQYIIPVRARKNVTELKKQALKAKTVYYATDEDREGEAIAWHLDWLFNHPKNSHRIAFHEITKTAIEAALKNPRTINEDLVKAQQARRILDRLVGYELSPLLWKKVAKGLSAGRVQSVAVRLIVEREREIKAFKQEEYWTIEAIFSKNSQKFTAILQSIDGKKLEKFDITNEQQASEIVKKIASAQFTVLHVEEKEIFKNPPTPFTTSTLQQRANRMLGFSAKQTMLIAQQLYEGLEIGEMGSVGLITYMRTDSLNLADQFLTEAQKFIKEKFGAEYALGPKKYQAKSKLAQEAHEAIRPTDPFLMPETVKPYLDSRQFKLYDLIWRRSLASQMPPAKIANTGIDLTDANGHLFRATGSVVVFEGFLKVLPHENEKEILPALKEGEAVKTEKIEPLQHFTEPPARYSEASLIKALEEYGIGRPSTYAPTIATIQSRNYVTSEEKRLKPTEIGFIVNDLLVEHFPKIVDYQFTAKIEDDFDRIAEGQEDWAKMLKEFYVPFHELVLQKQESVVKETSTATRELGTDPESGKPIFVRIGRFGPFVQKGSGEGDIKPIFASLKKGQSMDSVTLADALQLFTLPRTLGADATGETVIVNRGRFGPYVKIGSNNFSIRNEDPYTVTLDHVLEVIAAGRERKAKQTLKVFPGSEIKVLDGRYGPYITDGARNGKLPKNTKPEDLTLEQCQEALAAAPVKKARRAFKSNKKLVR